MQVMYVFVCYVSLCMRFHPSLKELLDGFSSMSCILSGAGMKEQSGSLLRQYEAKHAVMYSERGRE